MYFLENSKLLEVSETMQSMSNEQLMQMESGGSSISIQIPIVGNSDI